MKDEGFENSYYLEGKFGPYLNFASYSIRSNRPEGSHSDKINLYEHINHNKY